MKHLLQLSHRGRSEGDVSGVSFPLGEETEIFHRCIYVMMLSALLPAQSYVATAHRPAALMKVQSAEENLLESWTGQVHTCPP